MITAHQMRLERES